MISVDSDGDVAVVRLEHGKLNALDIEFLGALRTTMQELASAGAVVLTGTGRAFSAGVDLRRLVEGGPTYVEEFLPALSDAFLAIFDCPRPVVAALNGHAIAGGCVIAAATDLRLMSGGVIGLTELLVGVPFPPVALEISRYAFGNGVGRLALTGETFGVDDALRMGLIDEILAPDDLVTEAVRRAGGLARIPASIYAATKEQLHRATRRSIDERRIIDDQAVAAVWKSAATMTGIAAFLDRLAER